MASPARCSLPVHPGERVEQVDVAHPVGLGVDPERAPAAQPRDLLVVGWLPARLTRADLGLIDPSLGAHLARPSSRLATCSWKDRWRCCARSVFGMSAAHVAQTLMPCSRIGQNPSPFRLARPVLLLPLRLLDGPASAGVLPACHQGVPPLCPGAGCSNTAAPTRAYLADSSETVTPFWASHSPRMERWQSAGSRSKQRLLQPWFQADGLCEPDQRDRLPFDQLARRQPRPRRQRARGVQPILGQLDFPAVRRASVTSADSARKRRWRMVAPLDRRWIRTGVCSSS